MRRIADALLWMGAVLGALSLVAAVLVATLSLVPLVFTSGSMSPEIPAGSLGVARTVPAADLAVGDVVSVESAEGTRVTHRIVAVEESAGEALLTLQGDANGAPDAEPYPVTEADRLIFSVPGVGSVLSSLANPFVVFGAGVLAAGVVFGVWTSVRSSRGRPRAGSGETPDAEDRSDSADSAGRTGRVVASLLVVALPALVALQPAEPTAAAFSDTGTVNTSGFMTHRVGQPTGGTCSSSPSPSMTVTTPASDPRYTYWVRAYTAASGGEPVSSAKQMTGSGANRTVTVSPGEFSPALTAGTTYYLRVFARVAGTTWESAVYLYTPFSRSQANVLTCGEAPSPPTITFTEPLDGASNTGAVTRANVAARCGPNQAACGTATDSNGTVVSPVQYILRRTGFLGTQCWSGSSWVSSCNYRDTTFNASTGQWSVPATTSPYANQFLSTMDYTLTIQAKDNLDYTIVRTITYSVRPS
ncbi:signal peptidase I [Ruania suaedae]|uniref:signal peptidase I n=1 Tax=Ruania suaedae TaxID=2897774 RepID=UPI001E646B2C|nr:signal peptidase I [Ruania suaedae]UFU04644.1 signal peptidase I [Ruania suaedae]